MLIISPTSPSNDNVLMEMPIFRRFVFFFAIRILDDGAFNRKVCFVIKFDKVIQVWLQMSMIKTWIQMEILLDFLI